MENLRDFVQRRREFLNEYKKYKFFRAILDIAYSTGNSLGMLQLSDTVKKKLCSQTVMHLMKVNDTFGLQFYDLYATFTQVMGHCLIAAHMVC